MYSDRRVSRHTQLRMCVYSFRICKSVKRSNMQYNLKEKGGYAYFRALSIKYIQIVFIDAKLPILSTLASLATLAHITRF